VHIVPSDYFIFNAPYRFMLPLDGFFTVLLLVDKLARSQSDKHGETPAAARFFSFRLCGGVFCYLFLSRFKK